MKKCLLMFFFIFIGVVVSAEEESEYYKFPPANYPPAMSTCFYTTYENVEVTKNECSANFENDCKQDGGIVRDDKFAFNGIVWTKYCFPSSPDAGKTCKTDEECLAGCDFETAIEKNCTLIKTVKLEGEDIEEMIYACKKNNPATCLPAPVIKPMNGEMIRYKLDGKKLIKTILPGWIS